MTTVAQGVYIGILIGFLLTFGGFFLLVIGAGLGKDIAEEDAKKLEEARRGKL